jgi:plasmid maintenance system killer protein
MGREERVSQEPGLSPTERLLALMNHLGLRSAHFGTPAGTWSISVSGNWRLTFDIRQGEICNLDLEDYH